MVDSTATNGPPHEYCAYTASACLWSLENPLSMSSDSGAHEVLVCRDRYLHVGLLVLLSATTSAVL